MKSLIRPVLLSVCLPLLLNGCAAFRENTQLVPGPDYTTKVMAATGSKADKPDEQSPEKPQESPHLVKVIKGVKVSGPEEAKRLLEQKGAVKPSSQGLDLKLQSCLFREVKARQIAELLTEMSGYNIVVTNGVADRPVTAYFRDIGLREALEAICRVNDLWYREGKGIITLMTREEYVRDVESRQNDQTRAFFVRYSNAIDMAKVIQAAMGDEVRLTVIDDEKIYGHLNPDDAKTVTTAAAKTTTDSLTISPALLLGAGYLPTINASGSSTAAAATPAVSKDKAGGKSPAATAGQTAAAATAQQKRPLLAIMTVFKRSNSIIARSLDGALLNEMGRIIEALDTPTNQVLLEVKILQITLNDGFDSFFRFDYTKAGKDKNLGNFASALALGGSSVSGTSAFNFIFDSDKLDAQIAFFESKGRIQSFATPFLMAANNSKVEFFVGDETPLRDKVTSKTIPIGTDGTTINTFEVEIKREELGTTVKMNTFINEDNTVTLDIDAEISSALLNYSTTQVVNQITGDVIEYPLDGVSKTELKSILSAKSGQSIAIGGIIKETLDDTVKKVPFAGDIPGLGLLFRDVVKSKKKTETVIILTPHVIQHPALAGRASAEFLNRKSSHEHITKGKETVLNNDPVSPQL
jgi:type II secretory pathway component GspD/PulD (secretin)